MAAVGHPWTDIAAILGVSPSTVSRRGYATAIARGHARRKDSIRLAQNKLVAEGNPAMCIHLGRSELGQSYQGVD